MDLTKKAYKSKSKADILCTSFFSWFSDHLDAGSDEIADVRIQTDLIAQNALINCLKFSTSQILLVHQASTSQILLVHQMQSILT